MEKNDVPVFILAGGLGTRLAEETGVRPKPMVEVGGIPVLIHIMRWYYHHGFSDFVICAGYKSWEIKKYFLNYQFKGEHLSVDHRKSLEAHPEVYQNRGNNERWRVRVLDTGALTQTGARIAKAFDIVSKDQKIETFALTYGDGLSDVDLGSEFKFHREHGKVGTVLAVRPKARFGELVIRDTQVVHFAEKPESKQLLINGGYFFLNSGFRKYLKLEETCILERDPLEKLSTDGQLQSYSHSGYWHPMDTLSDKNAIQKLWDDGQAPWAPAR